MRIGDMVPLEEPQTIRDTSSDGEDSVQSVPSRLSEGQLEAITESPGDASTKSSQLLDNLAPDRLEPHRPENLFEDLVKIDVFANAPANLDLTQGLDPANLVRNPANPTAKEGDRRYLGVTGLDLPNLDPTGLLGGTKPSSGANVPRFVTGGISSAAGSGGGSSTSFVEGTGTRGSSPAGPTTLGGNSIVGGRDMSLVGTSWQGKLITGETKYNPDGSFYHSDSTKGGTTTDYYDPAGKRTGTSLETTAKGVTTSKIYDADGKLQSINEVSKDHNVTTIKVYDGDGKYAGKVVTSADGKATTYDKDGNEVKYDTGEGENVFQAPTAEEFLRIKNFGGGYTDGRPELQSNTQMEKRNPAEEDPNFGVIDGDPDYIEATLDRPNLGNKAQPETRPQLEREALEMPATSGGNPEPISNDPD